MESEYQEFWYQGNPEIKKTVSEKFYEALSISSLSKDIQEEIDGLKSIKFDYSHELKLLKRRWIVFWHGSGIGFKHKYIIKPTGLYCGNNGAMGSLQMAFEVVDDEYIDPKYMSESDKKDIDLWTNTTPCICDCRQLFHYVTYWFSPKYFQGTKVFTDLEKAKKYFNRIDFMTHYYGNNQLSFT